MKQMIVMISMILLGIAISATVMSFSTTAATVADNAKTTILSEVVTTPPASNP